MLQVALPYRSTTQHRKSIYHPYSYFSLTTCGNNPDRCCYAGKDTTWRSALDRKRFVGRSENPLSRDTGHRSSDGRFAVKRGRKVCDGTTSPSALACSIMSTCTILISFTPPENHPSLARIEHQIHLGLQQQLRAIVRLVRLETETSKLNRIYTWTKSPSYRTTHSGTDTQLAAWGVPQRRVFANHDQAKRTKTKPCPTTRTLSAQTSRSPSFVRRKRGK